MGGSAFMRSQFDFQNFQARINCVRPSFASSDRKEQAAKQGEEATLTKKERRKKSAQELADDHSAGFEEQEEEALADVLAGVEVQMVEQIKQGGYGAFSRSQRSTRARTAGAGRRRPRLPFATLFLLGLYCGPQIFRPPRFTPSLRRRSAPDELPEVVVEADVSVARDALVVALWRRRARASQSNDERRVERRHQGGDERLARRGRARVTL